MSNDFVLALSTAEVSDAVDIVSIKREIYNAMPWLSDYCKDEKLLSRETLTDTTLRIISYFKDRLNDESEDIHDYSGAKLEKMTSYDIRLRFTGYRD